MKSDERQPLARRALLAGAGTAGALAATAALIPLREPAKPETGAVVRADTDEPSGYRLSEHVMQYYRTARV